MNSSPFEDELVQILNEGRKAAQSFDSQWRAVRTDVIHPRLLEASNALARALEGSKPEVVLQNGGEAILSVGHGNYAYKLIFKPHREKLGIIRETNIKEYPPEFFTSAEHVTADAVKQEVRDFLSAISRGRPSGNRTVATSCARAS